MSKSSSQQSAAPTAGYQLDQVQGFQNVREALNGLRFGTVTVIVQDGFVVQVERTEKLRFVRRQE